MVIWSKNVFKGNLMLQFSWLEEFRQGKVFGWWTLDELQYENGFNGLSLGWLHISEKKLLKLAILLVQELRI